MTALILSAVLLSTGSLDSLDACVRETQEQIAQLEEEEAAVSTILDAIHQHLGPETDVDISPRTALILTQHFASFDDEQTAGYVIQP